MFPSSILRNALNRAPNAATNKVAKLSRPDLKGPLTGVFCVNKPQGILSTAIVDKVQHTCRSNLQHPYVRSVLSKSTTKRSSKGFVKIGHGGTLDPLARGVVVIGLGDGCKVLHSLTSSSKIYIAEGRLGFATSTLDSTGSLVATGPTDHITQDKLLEALGNFRGEIAQQPPLYSALMMDGKRLYDYARKGEALPRDIPTRKVMIYNLQLLSYDGKELPGYETTLATKYDFQTMMSEPQKTLYQKRISSDRMEPDSSSSTTATSQNDDDKRRSSRKKRLSDPSEQADFVPIPDQGGIYFHFQTHCSSGTYIRTLIEDIAKSLGTVGHMSDLLRIEQNGFALDGPATLEFKECRNLESINQAVRQGNAILKKQWLQEDFLVTEPSPSPSSSKS
ncbi:hypothetical protein DFQ26_002878 [Actinomortierella ambigua]|nr:hypothetical protein DFQ26_002878 [Actinomortierella ambigua]